jgi:hypothetical protein
MERYVFFDTSRIPSGLPVIRVPTPHGWVWVELTPAEYEAAVTSAAAARQLEAYAQEVLATRWPKPEGHVQG